MFPLSLSLQARCPQFSPPSVYWCDFGFSHHSDCFSLNILQSLSQCPYQSVAPYSRSIREPGSRFQVGALWRSWHVQSPTKLEGPWGQRGQQPACPGALSCHRWRSPGPCARGSTTGLVTQVWTPWPLRTLARAAQLRENWKERSFYSMSSVLDTSPRGFQERIF